MQYWELMPDADQLPALTLAYVGDAVFELYVRTDLLSQSRNAHTLNRLGVSRVNHHLQAALYDRIEPELDERERALLRRGRNAKGNPPKNADRNHYRKATAVEALAGYYHLSGQEDRLGWLMRQVEALKGGSKS